MFKNCDSSQAFCNTEKRLWKTPTEKRQPAPRRSPDARLIASMAGEFEQQPETLSGGAVEASRFSIG